MVDARGPRVPPAARRADAPADAATDPSSTRRGLRLVADREAAAGDARSMTPVGPPRTPPRGRRPAAPRPADRRRGAAARGPMRAAPAGRAASAARSPRRRRAARGRAPAGRSCACAGATLVLLLAGLRRHRRAPRAGAGRSAAASTRPSASRSGSRTSRCRPTAGSIFDRNGNDLAVSIPQRTVWADPRLIDDPAAVAAQLAPLLGLDAARARGAHHPAERRRPSSPTSPAGSPTTSPTRSRSSTCPASSCSTSRSASRRPATSPARCSGQVDVDNDGLSGLELQYDDLLTGEPGELIIERDPDGRTIPSAASASSQPAAAGRRPRAHDRPRRCSTRPSGPSPPRSPPSAPRAASPSCRDPAPARSSPSPTSSTDPETGAVRGRPATTWRSPPSFEPGSVNKVITVAAALEEGLVVAGDRARRCPTTSRSATTSSPTTTRTRRETYSVTRILAESSNIGTIKLAQHARQGPARRYLRRFGFGSKTALGFPSEAAGILLHARRVQRHLDRVDPDRPGHRRHRRCRCWPPTT